MLHLFRMKGFKILKGFVQAFGKPDSMFAIPMDTDGLGNQGNLISRNRCHPSLLDDLLNLLNTFFLVFNEGIIMTAGASGCHRPGRSGRQKTSLQVVSPSACASRTSALPLRP